MTLAERARQAAKKLGEFHVIALCDALEVRSYREQRSVRDTVREFLKRGELERIGTARYRYIGRKMRMTYRQRFWNIARRMRRFSLDDVEQITHANRDTIKEFCYWMLQKGYAERVSRGHFRVVGKLGPIVPKYNKRSHFDESTKA